MVSGWDKSLILVNSTKATSLNISTQKQTQSFEFNKFKIQAGCVAQRKLYLFNSSELLNFTVAKILRLDLEVSR